MLSEIISLAYDVVGLIPGAAEAEKIIAIGEDAAAAVQAFEAFMATPDGQNLSGFLSSVLTKQTTTERGRATIASITFSPATNAADYPGAHGKLMPPGM